MAEEIPDLTKHKDNFKTLLMLLSCQDSFNTLAEKWETDFPDQPIPEGFKNMMEIQFEFMRGMLDQKDCPTEVQKVIEEDFWELL